MKAANKLSLLLGLLCLSFGLSAHQPDLSSTILAEKEEGKWVLQIRAALTAFEYEVEARFGESAYTTPEEFRALVLEHLREELAVRFNDGAAVVLGEGVVNLGHETTATFQLSSPPAGVRSVTVANTGFGNISRSQSALYVAKEGFEKKQFMLNGDNGYEAALRADGSKFTLVTPAGASAYILPFLVLISALLAGVLVYLAYAQKKGSSPALPARKHGAIA